MDLLPENYLIGILKNEESDSAKKWSIACEKLGIEYKIIDMLKTNWLQEASKDNFTFFLLKPPGKLELIKQLYDERIFILNKVLGKLTYPSFLESYIYENKKLLSYFLESRKIPHPTTCVYYSFNDARRHLTFAKFPIVAKTAIGASGSGVKIITTNKKGIQYVRRAFSSKGIKRRFGPNRTTGSPSKWFIKALSDPDYLMKRIKEYLSIYQDGQRGFVIFQEFIHHDFEWRVAKIGDSFFAHHKIKYNQKASGSKGIKYVNPPQPLLDFVKDICEKNCLNSVAIDIFEDPIRGFLVNEIQTIFGHVQNHILEVNGNPGRYIYLNNQWVFEKGEFNSNESYDLRLADAIDLYSRGEL